MGSCVSKRFTQVDDRDKDHDGFGTGLMSGLRREDDSERSHSGAGKTAFDFGGLLSTSDSSDDDDIGQAGSSTSRKKDPF
jgi:hypothetical protein